MIPETCAFMLHCVCVYAEPKLHACIFFAVQWLINVLLTCGWVDKWGFYITPCGLLLFELHEHSFAFQSALAGSSLGLPQQFSKRLVHLYAPCNCSFAQGPTSLLHSQSEVQPSFVSWTCFSLCCCFASTPTTLQVVFPLVSSPSDYLVLPDALSSVGKQKAQTHEHLHTLTNSCSH